MKVRDSVANRFWTLASIEEVKLRCEEEGFAVTLDAHLGKHRVDLLAERGSLRRVFEFKSYRRGRTGTKVTALRNYVVHELGGEFQLVLVSPPRDREIEVEGIEALLAAWMTDHVPSELDSLSPHTYVDNVSDAFIDKITVRDNEIEIEGEATVEVTLQIDKEPDSSHDDSYPFSFRVRLDAELNLNSVEALQVDTSDFYK